MTMQTNQTDQTKQIKQPDYIEKIDQLKDEMIKDLQGLIRIKSVKEPPEDGAPFGAGVDEAFNYMLELGRREGFASENIDGYGGHIDFAGKDNDDIMGILCHLDVVPEGSGWDFEPYGAGITDGCMTGRGTLDDKGPTICAFYAMKAIKDCGYVPAKKIRMVIGLDEETGSEGMHYYSSKVRMPDRAIVPDADFPLVHGEMGILIFDIVKKFSGRTAAKGGVTVKKLTGGNAPNMVPDEAVAVLSADRKEYPAIREKVQAFAESTGYDVTAKNRGSSIAVTVKGKSAHGAHPWDGVNAITIMMDFLQQLELAEDGQADFVKFYNERIGSDLHGERMGCCFEDEISGKLIFNAGMIEMDENAVKLTVNIRNPISRTDDDVYDGMAFLTELYDIGFVKDEYQKPVYFPVDDPAVQLLLSIYRKHTGDMESEPLVLGGGTYARQMDNAIAFGALYPGDPDTMHQKNECVRIDRLVQTAKIYAETLFRMAVEPEV